MAYDTRHRRMSYGKRLMRSAARIVAAVSVIAVIGMALLFAAVRQPMIGYFSDDQAWPNWLFEMMYPSKGDFIGVTGGWRDRQLARAVKRAVAGASDLRVVSYSGSRSTSDGSDQRNYRAHGWRAVMVTDTAFLRNPNYHTSRDTADTLDYDQMALVVDGILNAVLHLSSGERISR